MPAKKKVAPKKKKVELCNHFLSNRTIEKFASEGKCALMHEYLKPIAEMLRCEHYRRREMPFTSELGIYLDGVEAELAKHDKVDRKCTVDFLFGVGNDWILLTEAKLDVCRPGKMSVSDLKDKINHSKELITNNEMSYHIEPTTIVLLKDENFSQSYRELKQKVSNSLKIEPMTVSQLYKSVFEKK